MHASSRLVSRMATTTALILTLTAPAALAQAEPGRSSARTSATTLVFDKNHRNPNDFLSNGCIKLRPAQIKDMFALLDRIGRSRTLKVIS